MLENTMLMYKSDIEESVFSRSPGRWVCRESSGDRIAALAGREWAVSMLGTMRWLPGQSLVQGCYSPRICMLYKGTAEYIVQ